MPSRWPKRLRFTPSQCATNTLRRNGSVARLRGRIPGKRCQKLRPQSLHRYLQDSTSSTQCRNPQLSCRGRRRRLSLIRSRWLWQCGHTTVPTCRAAMRTSPATSSMQLIWYPGRPSTASDLIKRILPRMFYQVRVPVSPTKNDLEPDGRGWRRGGDSNPR